MRRDNLSRHIKIHTKKNKSQKISIVDELIHDDKMYDENVVLGEKIASIITAGQTKEESLSKKNKHCLELYRKNRRFINVQEQELKKWQSKLMEYFTQEEGSSYREVVWIVGKRGNKGKADFNPT